MVYFIAKNSFVAEVTFKRQICHNTETSQLICSANQLTGFYMMTTLAFNELGIARM